MKRPVVFQAAGEVTFARALARAEGLSPEAGGEILLSHPRADGQPALVQRIPVKALIDDANPALNVRTTPAAAKIFAYPGAGRVVIVGRVKPGSFTVRDESEATVLRKHWRTPKAWSRKCQPPGLHLPP